LNLRPFDGKVAFQIVPPHSRNPSWKSLGADSEEKHEPASDIGTAMVNGLEVLDSNRPIREATIGLHPQPESDRHSYFQIAANRFSLAASL
jgi:hypothetical protein